MDLSTRLAGLRALSLCCVTLALATFSSQFATPALAADEEESEANIVADDKVVQTSGEEEEKVKHRIRSKAFLSVDKLPAGRTCEIVVFLSVAKGWHIHQNPAKPEDMIPTVVELKSKHGAKIKSVKYPEGEPITMPGIDELVHVYSGIVKIRGTVEVPADIPAGKEDVELLIKYQSCDDELCEPPKTLKLRTKIDVAAAGESVQPANQKYFKD